MIVKKLSGAKLYTQGDNKSQICDSIANFFFKGGYPSRLRPFSGPVFCVDLQPIHSDQDHQGDLGS